MSATHQPTVAVIVLNWNGEAYLTACLSALLAQPYPQLQVIVADNDSADNSISLVRDQFPQVTLVENGRNLGFGAGNNAALDRISAEIVLFVNPDVVVADDWLAHMLAPFADDPNVGIVGCKLLYPESNLIQYAGGAILPPRAESTHNGMRQPDTGQFDQQRDVGYVIGAAMAVRQTVFDRIGRFDPGYFLYYEDADLCERARRAGFRVLFTPHATATHHESAVIGLHSPFYWQQFHLGRLRYALKQWAWATQLDAFIAAETAWAQTVRGNERLGAWLAYRATGLRLDAIWRRRTREGAPIDRLIARRVAQMVGDMQQRLATPAPEDDNALSALATLREYTFVSNVPVFGRLIAGLRTAWFNVAARWALRDALQQQSDFNRQVTDRNAALRRTLTELTAWSEQQDADRQRLQQELDALRATVDALRHRLNLPDDTS